MMSNRRKNGAKNRVVAYIAAGILHLLLIGALVFNYLFDDSPKMIEGFDADKVDTVKASVIDESKIKDQQEKLRKSERDRLRKKREEKERELAELNKIKQQVNQEKKNVDNLKALKEAEKLEAEQQRNAIALNKKKAEEQRKKEEKIARNKAEAEKKRIAKLKKQLAEEEAALRERQRLNKLLDEETERQRKQEAERRAKERTATAIDQFMGRARQKIENKRVLDPAFETWRKSVVEIKLSPSGSVEWARTIESSGLPEYDQSAERAIYAAGPFQMPDSVQYPNAHRTALNFELDVIHPNARR